MLLMKKRVISAIIMLALFIPIVIIGGVPFLVVASIIGLLGLKEMLVLEEKVPLVMKLSTYFFALFMIMYNYRDNNLVYALNYKFLIIMILFYMIGVVVIGNTKKYSYKDALFLIGSIMLIGIIFNGFVIVRNLGAMKFFYLFLISVLTDSFALFTGKYFGRRKISPKLSPNKTLEGCIGGSVLGTLITTLIYVSVGALWDKFFVIFGSTLLLSILGQVGDLFFSSIKRYHGIKDFSNLIPGHGGILDRIDSVSFILLGYALIFM